MKNEKWIVTVDEKAIACDSEKEAMKLFNSVPSICDSVFESIFVYAPNKIDVDGLKFVNADYIIKHEERQMVQFALRRIHNPEPAKTRLEKRKVFASIFA